MTPFLLAMQDVPTDALGGIGEALVPIGGAALIAVCLRLAVAAYRDMATTAAAREKVCVETVAGMTAATTALTAEVKRAGDGQAQQLTELQIGMRELLDHARRGGRGGPG